MTLTIMALEKGDAFDHDSQVQLHEMRKQGIFCDCCIQVPDEDVKFPVHRVIMASCSHYFRSLFTSNVLEYGKNEIKICGVSASTMDSLIQYAYLRYVPINSENVEDLFAAADRFHIFGLLKECSDFLLDQLAPENCIGILKFTRFYNCDFVASKAWKFILENFKEVWEKSQEFIQLDKDDLMQIITDDELCVGNESEVFSAVQRWIEFDPNDRLSHYPQLLTLLRLAFIDPNFFEKRILNNNEILKHKSSHSVLERASKLIDLVQNSGAVLVDLDDHMMRPRVPSDVIFTVGGWSNEGVVSSVETYDKSIDQWFDLSEHMSSARAYHGTVCLDTRIFIIGGFDRSRYLNSVGCFSTEKRVWEERAPMYMARCYVSAAVLDGFIYACGGFDGRQRHNSVERYDADHNQWTYVQPMNHNRSDAGTTALNGYLYITGGFDGHSCLDSAEVYDPRVNQWTVLHEMTTRRSGVALVTLSDSILAIGGYDGSHRLRTVEKFDIKRRAWTHMPPMNLGRSNFSAIVCDDKIYVIGGYDGSTTSSNVECYDIEKKQWRKLRDLNAGRSAVTACLVKCSSNSRYFTFHGHHDLSEQDTNSCHNTFECLK